MVEQMEFVDVEGIMSEIRTQIKECGYAKKDFAEAHMRSYLRTDVWGDYDVLGFKGGSAKIIIDEKDIESYGAYIIPLLKDLPRIDMSHGAKILGKIRQ